MIGYKRKNVTFNEKESADMKLHSELQKLPHGDFSRITKEMWAKRLKESEGK